MTGSTEITSATPIEEHRRNPVRYVGDVFLGAKDCGFRRSITTPVKGATPGAIVSSIAASRIFGHPLTSTIETTTGVLALFGVVAVHTLSRRGQATRLENVRPTSNSPKT